MPVGEPGAVVGDLEHRLAVARSTTETVISVPGGRVADAVVEQVERPAGAARRGCPHRHRRRGRQRQLVAVGDRAHLGERRGGDLGEVALAPRRRRGPASARASSSRSETRRLIRREEPSADGDDLLLVAAALASRRGSPGAARGWRGCWSAGCAARARRRRRTRAAPASSARSRSARRRAREASGRASRASSPTSSSVSGSGMRREGSRVAAISRAAAVSAEIGRIARPATAIPASAASTVPPSTPPARNSHSRLMVASRLSRAAGVLDVDGRGAELARESSGAQRRRSRRPRGCRRLGRPEVGRAPASAIDRLAVRRRRPAPRRGRHLRPGRGSCARAPRSMAEPGSRARAALADVSQLVVEVVLEPVGDEAPDDERRR